MFFSADDESGDPDGRDQRGDDSVALRMSYHGREVTAAVPAGPTQGADNVEHLKLELWTEKTSMCCC